MNYPNGESAKLGDEVRLWYGANGKDDAVGEVVCSIDTDEYTDAYPRSEWSYLKHGILVLSPQAGLIHYVEPELTMALLRRRNVGV